MSNNFDGFGYITGPEDSLQGQDNIGSGRGTAQMSEYMRKLLMLQRLLGYDPNGGTGVPFGSKVNT